MEYYKIVEVNGKPQQQSVEVVKVDVNYIYTACGGVYIRKSGKPRGCSQKKVHPCEMLFWHATGFNEKVTAKDEEALYFIDVRARRFGVNSFYDLVLREVRKVTKTRGAVYQFIRDVESVNQKTIKLNEALLLLLEKYHENTRNKIFKKKYRNRIRKKLQGENLIKYIFSRKWRSFSHIAGSLRLMPSVLERYLNGSILSKQTRGKIEELKKVYHKGGNPQKKEIKCKLSAFEKYKSSVNWL